MFPRHLAGTSASNRLQYVANASDLFTEPQVLFSTVFSTVIAKGKGSVLSIYTANGDEVDTAYLAAQMKRSALVIPSTAEPFSPSSLLAMSGDIRRQLHRRS